MAKSGSKRKVAGKAEPGASNQNPAPTAPPAPQTTKGVPILDNQGRVVRLGEMQQWVVDCLRNGDKSAQEIASVLREDEGRTITRLRQLVTKGVVLLQQDMRWSLTSGPATPREPLPRLRRR